MKKIMEFRSGFLEGLEMFGSNINIIVNSIMLSSVYVLGVGMTHIFARLCGKHFLDIKLSKEKKSYWSVLNLKKRPINEYYRQF